MPQGLHRCKRLSRNLERPVELPPGLGQPRSGDPRMPVGNRSAHPLGTPVEPGEGIGDGCEVTSLPRDVDVP